MAKTTSLQNVCSEHPAETLKVKGGHFIFFTQCIFQRRVKTWGEARRWRCFPLDGNPQERGYCPQIDVTELATYHGIYINDYKNPAGIFFNYKFLITPSTLGKWCVQKKI